MMCLDLLWLKQMVQKAFIVDLKHLIREALAEHSKA